MSQPCEIPAKGPELRLSARTRRVRRGALPVEALAAGTMPWAAWTEPAQFKWMKPGFRLDDQASSGLKHG